jgi:drug/metabolite transporter (DMT)-like permease
LKTILYTILALFAFAANSVLCRLALGKTAIDAPSFTTIRLASGALVLVGISVWYNRKSRTAAPGNWPSAAMLFLYAVAFSFAYLSLSIGTGALILFGGVQTTMIVGAFLSGERPRPLTWAGLLVAFAGLVYLVFPGLRAPSLIGSALMGVAGMAWGGYSLRGRGASHPLFETSSNFVRSVPLAVAVSLIMIQTYKLTANGILLAVISGAITSGLGYVIWYAALKGLTATRAAMVQLAVPVLAAFAGVIFLTEDISIRLIISAVLILGGIGLAVTKR